MPLEGASGQITKESGPAEMSSPCLRFCENRASAPVRIPEQPPSATLVPVKPGRVLTRPDSRGRLFAPGFMVSIGRLPELLYRGRLPP